MSIVKAPSPALVISCVALFVALGGTAIAAAPIAKRALFANNAGKLQGKTAGAGRGSAGTCVQRSPPGLDQDGALRPEPGR